MKLFKYILPLMLLSFTFVACENTLEDVQPDQSLDADGALSNADAILAVRTSLYSRMHSFGYTTNYFLGAESIADNMQGRPGTSRFNALNSGGRGAGLSVRGDTWGIVHRANLLLAVEDGVLPAATQDYVRGEAYFFRAFAMHNNVRVLGYEPGMAPATGEGAGFVLGDIIRTEAVQDINAVDARPRNTVTEVYTQIKADLALAIPLLAGRTNRNFITAAAAEALYARVLLYERNYAGALTRASNARASTSAVLTPESRVFNMFDELAGTNPGGIFVVTVDPNNESQGVNSSLAAYTSKQWVAQIPSASVLALYDPADARNGWFSACDNEPANAPDTDDPRFRLSNCNGINGGFELNKWDGEKGQFADDLPFFRVEEMVLIQAEASLGNPATSTPVQIANSIAFLNELRTRRGLAAFLPTDFVTGADLLNEILDERRREFIGEGQRFFDLKRLGRDIPKASANTVPYTDIRILDDISVAELQANPELVNNPGY